MAPEFARDVARKKQGAGAKHRPSGQPKGMVAIGDGLFAELSHHLTEWQAADLGIVPVLQKIGDEHVLGLPRHGDQRREQQRGQK